MGRARIAVTTSMGATIVWVDGTLKADVGALVLTDDGSRAEWGYRRRNLGRSGGVFIGPPVVESLDLGGFEAAAGVRFCAAPSNG